MSYHINPQYLDCCAEGSATYAKAYESLLDLAGTVLNSTLLPPAIRDDYAYACDELMDELMEYLAPFCCFAGSVTDDTLRVDVDWDAISDAIHDGEVWHENDRDRHSRASEPETGGHAYRLHTNDHGNVTLSLVANDVTLWAIV